MRVGSEDEDGLGLRPHPHLLLNARTHTRTPRINTQASLCTHMHGHTQVYAQSLDHNRTA